MARSLPDGRTQMPEPREPEHHEAVRRTDQRAPASQPLATETAMADNETTPERTVPASRGRSLLIAGLALGSGAAMAAMAWLASKSEEAAVEKATRDRLAPGDRRGPDLSDVRIGGGA